MRLVANLFLFFKKTWFEVKASGRSLVSIYFDSSNLPYNKNKLHKTSDYWSRDMLNFNFSEKSLRLVSPTNFMYDFSRKMFLMLHSINWPNFIVLLPLLLEILGNMYITIVCKPNCEVIKIEINLIFLMKPFRYITKRSRPKLKYVDKEKSFWGEIESIFHHF